MFLEGDSVRGENYWTILWIGTLFFVLPYLYFLFFFELFVWELLVWLELFLKDFSFESRLLIYWSKSIYSRIVSLISFCYFKDCFCLLLRWLYPTIYFNILAEMADVLVFPIRDVVGTDSLVGTYELFPTCKFFIEHDTVLEIVLIVLNEFSAAERFFDLLT